MRRACAAPRARRLARRTLRRRLTRAGGLGQGGDPGADGVDHRRIGVVASGHDQRGRRPNAPDAGADRGRAAFGPPSGPGSHDSGHTGRVAARSRPTVAASASTTAPGGCSASRSTQPATAPTRVARTSCGVGTSPGRPRGRRPPGSRPRGTRPARRRPGGGSSSGTCPRPTDRRTRPSPSRADARRRWRGRSSAPGHLGGRPEVAHHVAHVHPGRRPRGLALDHPPPAVVGPPDPVVAGGVVRAAVAVEAVFVDDESRGWTRARRAGPRPVPGRR